MSKTKNIRTHLGITQQQLAMLLGVSRSTLSLYELGKRNLPIEAKIKLTQLLEQSQSRDLINKVSFDHLSKDKKLMIEKFIQNNQIGLYQLQKKLVLLQKKKIKNEAHLNLINHLKEVQNSDIKNEKYLFMPFQNEINAKASTKILLSIFKLEIKIKLLLKEQEVLKAILQRY